MEGTNTRKFVNLRVSLELVSQLDDIAKYLGATRQSLTGLAVEDFIADFWRNQAAKAKNRGVEDR